MQYFKWGVSPHFEVLKDHRNTAAEIPLGEAYGIKGLLFFIDPRRGRCSTPHKGPNGRSPNYVYGSGGSEGKQMHKRTPFVCLIIIRPQSGEGKKGKF